MKSQWNRFVKAGYKKILVNWFDNTKSSLQADPGNPRGKGQVGKITEKVNYTSLNISFFNLLNSKK